MKINFSMAEGLFDALLGMIHPVVIYSEDENFPYWGVGTAFTVAWQENIYLVSAKHIWVNQKTTPKDIRIFLRTSGVEIRFDREAIMKDDYEPSQDLLVMRVYPDDIESLRANGLNWLDICYAIDDDISDEDKNYVVFGYPDTHRSYDYTEKQFSASLGILFGKKTSPQLPKLESLSIRTDENRCLRGYSGSPVIRYANGQMEFSGMVIAGSGVSGVVNYIPAQFIAELLFDVDNLEHQGLLLDY
ncbi:hypothetical protein G7025_21475 [Pseudomonas lurida]|uniref:hypothetical protein n=1 Tax=Pseudomonas TaxID=286 RepID=UPI0015E36A45|nr:MULTISPECIES: hypothetical protein [Pseudomonas]MBA1295942.1 hypothetical protein [Pseudomonas lurida]